MLEKTSSGNPVTELRPLVVVFTQAGNYVLVVVLVVVGMVVQ